MGDEKSQQRSENYGLKVTFFALTSQMVVCFLTHVSLSSLTKSFFFDILMFEEIVSPKGKWIRF